VLYPALTLKNAEMVVNFGDTPFKFGPPEGFVGLAKAPADVTVSAAAAATAATAGNSSERKPLCLVLEPSRDLAEQTHKCFQAYGKHLSTPALSSVLLVGGLDPGAQFKALKEGAQALHTLSHYCPPVGR
jgi:ATP-dependent RNA helicase DDX1